MPGVRIRPQPDRPVPDDAIIVVTDVTRPFPAPKDGTRLEHAQPICHLCGVQHFAKTYHLRLTAGSVIVSETVWLMLQRLIDCGGMEYMNHVGDPPTQKIGIGDSSFTVDLVEKYVLPI